MHTATGALLTLVALTFTASTVHAQVPGHTAFTEDTDVFYVKRQTIILVADGADWFQAPLLYISCGPTAPHKMALVVAVDFDLRFLNLAHVGVTWRFDDDEAESDSWHTSRAGDVAFIPQGLRPAASVPQLLGSERLVVRGHGHSRDYTESFQVSEVHEMVRRLDCYP